MPWHLTTVEYTREIKRVLTPEGIYTLNVIDFNDRDFVRSATMTLREVFGHVALFAPNSYINGSGGGNYVLVASENPIDIPAIEARVRQRGGSEVGIDDEQLTSFAGDAFILTDDFAPVDQMLGIP
ncbi:MAG TPA: fused MFS/spermidine synthase [Acidimicrobiia bacterium]|nr:fused MFS/spermidine synthase [Acidimicrobiia bacterium]